MLKAMPVRTLVKRMKTTMVERVSNADRARYTLRTSPNARQGKDQAITISLQQREDHHRDGTAALPPSHSIDRPINLATPTKMIVARKQK
jgi:hypothetical protein